MTITISPLKPEVLIETSAARVAVQGEIGRVSLRARGDISPLNKALGLELPTKIGTRASDGALEAVCLGPDEWTLCMPKSEVASRQAACDAVYDALPHSFADISTREMTLEISGPRAAELLTIGAPRDLKTIAVGEARRTIFDGATVVLWCDAENAYRMDLWNSFAGYSADLLVTGAKELAAEAA